MRRLSRDNSSKGTENDLDKICDTVSNENGKGEYMSEQKKKISKLCLAGFLLSILLPVLMIVMPKTGLFKLFDKTGLWISVGVYISLPLAGLILSIAGLVTARKKGRKGKGFGIAGIILPVIYAVIALVVFLFGYVFLSFLTDTFQKKEQSDLFAMDGITQAINTEYDVRQYKISQDFNLSSLNSSVSKNQFRAYAEDKLQTIDNESENTIRGKYQDYDFLIVRSNHFSDWLENEGMGNIIFKEGYMVVTFYAPAKSSTGSGFDVYMDPSGKYIIITNCNDYKVITEFFE
ncbi:hypothetical protein [Butyrivibrio sp. AE2032]|uniref:hypothetical protein n=1 Tax=Butyrivibrio sp. AE2032 TaxID=1458463 RepID=UPI00055998C7|nr:hypothetical protein [Butyrivibrio sp. AE2032]